MRKIPFLARFLPAIRDGRKTMTCRTRRYGEVGDVLWWSEGRLRLLTVEVHPLETVAKLWWREEGCASAEEFRRVWAEIHRRNGWEPERQVWVHRFERVDPRVEDRCQATTRRGTRCALHAPPGFMFCGRHPVVMEMK